METENVPHGLAPGNATATRRAIVFAPNWLGDAVMALPAIADLGRALPDAQISVAARPAIAPLFSLVPGLASVLTLDARSQGDTARLRDGAFDTAILLPNAFRTALAAWRAGVPARWGYRTQGRGWLLTRAVATPTACHQGEYYQHLMGACGIPAGPLTPRLDVPAAVRSAGGDRLRSEGWDGRAPIVALAPGAAYGGAKRWPSTSFAAVAGSLVRDGARVVLVGGSLDRDAAEAVRTAMSSSEVSGVMDLVGRTDLPLLAGVLLHCRALVSNDSGAMHVGAALGVPVTAPFGPTDERATRPLGAGHTVLTARAWCRPCLLRECPLDHRCMTRISADAVSMSLRPHL
jgi:heptosyltransferase-2